MLIVEWNGKMNGRMIAHTHIGRSHSPTTTMQCIEQMQKLYKQAATEARLTTTTTIKYVLFLFKYVFAIVLRQPMSLPIVTQNRICFALFFFCCLPFFVFETEKHRRTESDVQK